MSGSCLYEENNFKPRLTKQLSNVFKLWCECGIRVRIWDQLCPHQRQESKQ